MWIFMNDAFVSIVDKGGDGSTLLVRGRHAGDIERVFPGAKVERTPARDYLFRARVSRTEVAERIAERLRGIEYPNFKASVKEVDRHDAYGGVWGEMNEWQERAQAAVR